MAQHSPALQHLDLLRAEFEECERQESRKDDLIRRLFLRIEESQQTLEDATSQLQKEKDLGDLYSSRAHGYQQQLHKIEDEIASNTFVSVLIDGDCMQFVESLLSKGEAGGCEASKLLKAAVEDYVTESPLNVPQKSRILIRVYANIQGLAGFYKRHGLLTDEAALQDFVRGFNMANPLCEYIDSGNGKECSDEKLRENFRLQIADVHCKHLIFGGSADNGYARLLGPYSATENIASKITMLEGPPFAKELLELKQSFRTIAFSTVLRDSKLPRLNTAAASIATKPIAMNVGSPRSIGAKSCGSVFMVNRNKRGQRVDVPLEYDLVDVEELKQTRLCYQYHIMGRCSYGSRCAFPHGPVFDDRKVQALRFIARWAPCPRGLQCGSAQCVLGHQCARDGSCNQACRFPASAHGVDTKIVSS